MGCILGKKMFIIPSYFKFFYCRLLLLNSFSTVPQGLLYSLSEQLAA